MLEQWIAQLGDADAQRRYEAAQSLGASKDERAVEALMALVPDANAKVQYAAVSGLIKLGQPRAADTIVRALLADPDSRLWDLLKLNVGSRLRGGLLAMIAPGDVRMADRLTAALEAASLDEQQEAFVIRLLGRTRDARAVERLIEHLIQDTPAIQGAAAEALGYIGDQRAVAPLLLSLSDETNEVREIAVEALGRLGDKRAFQPLVSALEDENEWVRRAACVALGTLGNRAAMEALAGALRDEAVMVQDAAFEAIKQLSDDSFKMVL